MFWIVLVIVVVIFFITGTGPGSPLQPIADVIRPIFLSLGGTLTAIIVLILAAFFTFRRKA